MRAVGGREVGPTGHDNGGTDDHQDCCQPPGEDLAASAAWRGTVALRWVLVHMVEEYAQHNGHADLLREFIDGRIGR